jgi:hypothetical protein
MSSFYSEVNVKKARKSHKCECCRRLINKGESYQVQKGFIEGDFYSANNCPICQKALDWVAETTEDGEGFQYDMVWEIVREHLFRREEMDLVPWNQVISYMKERFLERLGESVDSGVNK